MARLPPTSERTGNAGLRRRARHWRATTAPERWLVLAVVGALALAGCAGTTEGEDADRFVVRTSGHDSLLLLTIDAVDAPRTYAGLLVIINEEAWRIAPRMDFQARLFEVQGKDRESDPIAPGDSIRLPVAGAVALELRDRATGATLFSTEVQVPDLSQPARPSLLIPGAGAAGVSREPVFAWMRVVDPSGITYELQYWITSPPLNLPPETISEIQGTSYAIPSSERLVPGAAYHWRVRAIDGAGNIGAWSEERDFTSSL